MKKLILLIIFLIVGCTNSDKMIDLTNKTLEEVNQYALSNGLTTQIEYQYSNVSKGLVIDQSITKGTVLKKDEVLVITISSGEDKEKLYKEYSVNELGRVPIMMYHGIEDKLDSDTSYTSGNIGKDGYHRTKESFIRDLEFYYEQGYRMIRLEDYVNGVIDVEIGKSPIILTFDDGLVNNIRVTGLDRNGNIIIDPNSAIGILESFKEKYPDYNVTATFFINEYLFRQSEYNDKILNWLINNGYDIGNHSYTHANFTKIDASKTEEEIGKMYDLLDQYIEGKYVNIVALPFGSPYKKSHDNFSHILSSSYNGKTYQTISTLQVGWESNYSPFSSDFDKSFLKRIRAYDNNGNNFDIEYSFNKIKNTRYISDGDKNKIVVPKNNKVSNLYDLDIEYY